MSKVWKNEMTNMFNKGKHDRGFTLIELMIVIAIVAILVALAVPAYRDYTIRAKIAECINGAAIAKVQVSEYRQSLGGWPPSQQEAGINAPSGASQFCTGFINYSSATGSFVIDMDEAAIDSLLTGAVAPVMVPNQVNSGIINWDCRLGSTSVAMAKYLPSTCRNTS